jgi:hypothetical protein
MGYAAPRSEIDAVFDSIDTDHSGALTFKELREVLPKSRQQAFACRKSLTMGKLPQGGAAAKQGGASSDLSATVRISIDGGAASIVIVVSGGEQAAAAAEGASPKKLLKRQSTTRVSGGARRSVSSAPVEVPIEPPVVRLRLVLLHSVAMSVDVYAGGMTAELQRESVEQASAERERKRLLRQSTMGGSRKSMQLQGSRKLAADVDRMDTSGALASADGLGVDGSRAGSSGTAGAGLLLAHGELEAEKKRVGSLEEYTLSTVHRKCSLLPRYTAQGVHSSLHGSQTIHSPPTTAQGVPSCHSHR